MNKIIIVLFILSTLSFAEEGSFYVSGEAIKAISLTLGVSSIDFGDVYTDTDVDPVLVDFSVNAEANYYYDVEITNDDSSGVVQVSKTSSGGYTDGKLTYSKLIATGNDDPQEFYVDLDTENMTDDLSATITVTVAYSEIPSS